MTDQIVRIKSLDGLRGIAALVVVISHVSNATSWLGGLLGSGAGQVGVMIFFALSGYLMGALYLDRPFRGAAVLEYAIHRVARVAPLYYAVVAASVLLAGIAPQIALYAINAENIRDHVALVRGVDVLWTIPVEMQFYALFVALWSVRAFSIAAFVLACTVLIIAPLWLLGDDPRWTFTLAKSVAFFMTGVLASRVVQPRPATASGWWWSIVFSVAAASTIILYPNVFQSVFGERPGNMWLSPMYLTVIALLLVSTVKAPLAQLLLGSPVMAFLGAISYSVYLLHMPILRAVDATTGLRADPLVFLGVVVGCTIGVAAAVHFLFERPVRHLINRAAPSLTPNPSTRQ